MIPPLIRLFMASDLSSLVDFSSEDIAKSILVSGITPGTKREAIVIHFQQHKHGGGDVSSVKFSQNGDKAVITFEEKESKFILFHRFSFCCINHRAFANFLGQK